MLEAQPEFIEILPLLWRGMTHLLLHHEYRLQIEFGNPEHILKNYFDVIKDAWSYKEYPVVLGPEGVTDKIEIINLPIKILLDRGIVEGLAGSEMREHIRGNMGLYSSTLLPNFNPFTKAED